MEGGDGDADAMDEDEGNAKGKKRGGKSEDQYYIVTVKDNGCGMAFDAIPNMLGIVLSGSKYGVRQTRGKFGLGAKMALIWGKKSTGVPVKVRPSEERSHELATQSLVTKTA